MKSIPTIHVYGNRIKHVEWVDENGATVDMDAMLVTDIDRHIEAAEGVARTRVTFIARLVEHEDADLQTDKEKGSSAR
jgi:hypothetical protein